MTQIFYKHQFIKGKFYLSYENDDNNVKVIRIFMFKGFNSMDENNIQVGIAYHAVVFSHVPPEGRVILAAEPLQIFGEMNNSKQYISFKTYEYFQLNVAEVNRILMEVI